MKNAIVQMHNATAQLVVAETTAQAKIVHVVVTAANKKREL